MWMDFVRDSPLDLRVRSPRTFADARGNSGSFPVIDPWYHHRRDYWYYARIARELNHVPFPPSMLMYGPGAENFQPPPAHMGIHIHRPHPHLKTGLGRPSMYTPLPPAGQFGPFGPGIRVQHSWNVPPEMYRPLSHLPPPSFYSTLPTRSQATENPQQIIPLSEDEPSESNCESKPHVKKPLNAFMLYMKDKRAEVMEEYRLKESAQINQVLGRRWHQLPKEEQAKYYERASREKDEHQQKYPDWSARENYAANVKKKKRKREKSVDADGNNPKKCRARFGLEKQDKWCKPCRRKKKCVRYLSDSASTSENVESSLEDSPARLSDGDSGNVEDEGPSSVSSNSASSIPTPSAPAIDEST